MNSALKKRALKFWRWARPMIFVIIFMTSLRSAVADWNDVPTGSMNPTILEGDRIFVNKLAYDLKVPYTMWRLASWSRPQRGDIVVFNSPKDGTRLVKRVIGLPGDTIEFRNDRLFINSQAASYEFDNADAMDRRVGVEETPQLSHSIQILPGVRAMRSFGPIVVPESQYWMMGDNRDVSFDSRYFGPVPMANILGKAPAIVVSLDLNNHYSPRWDRFFTSLK